MEPVKFVNGVETFPEAGNRRPLLKISRFRAGIKHLTQTSEPQRKPSDNKMTKQVSKAPKIYENQILFWVIQVSTFESLLKVRSFLKGFFGVFNFLQKTNENMSTVA
jgi:hypothetical protein